MAARGQRRKMAGACLLAGLAASGVILYLLAEFHEEIAEPLLTRLDGQLMLSVHAHFSPSLTALMEAFTFIGSVAVVFPAMAVLALSLWLTRHRRGAILLLAAMSGAAVLNVSLKLHFRRLRPDVPWALAHEHSFSFPSGHSLFAMVLYGALAYLALSHAKLWWARTAIVCTALFLVLAIGVSRVYLGVHYPTDVAAGYLVGLVWLGAVFASDWYLRRERRSA